MHLFSLNTSYVLLRTYCKCVHELDQYLRSKVRTIAPQSSDGPSLHHLKEFRRNVPRDKNKLQEDRRKYRREYYAENSNKIKESTLGYYFQNKDRMKESQRRYRLQHRGEMALYERGYRRRHKDTVNESQRRYYFRDHVNPDAYLARDFEFKSWKSPQSLREYFEFVALQLRISSPADWRRVSRPQITELGGRALYNNFESLGHALSFAYPESAWDLTQFSWKGKKSNQRLLKILVSEILPGIDIIENFLHPDMTWESGRKIELDIWIPKYSIGLEYQGEHHYHNATDSYGPNGTASLYSDRDRAKDYLCQTGGITLITIPFWWDGESESLSAALRQARPDVFPLYSST